MSIDFQSLIDLEQLDIEIAKLENSKKEYPIKVEEMSVALNSKKDALDKLLREIAEAESESSKAESSVFENKEGLENSHERLNLVKTNREYDAILLEINERKEMIDRSNKRVVKARDKMKKLNTQLEDVQLAFDEVSADLQPQIDELTSKIGSIDNDVKSVAEKRPGLADEIPEKFKVAYGRLNDKRTSGRLLSPINGESKSCGYCFQLMSPNVMKRVQGSETPVLCENCGSIIVWLDKPTSSDIKTEEK
jgi:predicted  nucleic acid-binding Zn-ribbon protein